MVFGSIGKGVFNVRIENMNERDHIFKRRSWSTKFGTFRLQQWIPEFNPYKVSSPIINVWARIYELPMEYFKVPIIEAIASVIGPIVSIDERTESQTYYHHAYVLIELDLRKEKEYNSMYERSGNCSIASVGYETHPDYCTHCQIVGHSIDSCRSAHGKNPSDDKDGNKRPRQTVLPMGVAINRLPDGPLVRMPRM